MLESLDGLLKDLYKGRDSAPFDCDSILLGALIKGMGEKHFLPRPEPPFLGSAYIGVAASIRNMQSPSRCVCNKSYGYLDPYGCYQKQYGCSLEQFTGPILTSLRNTMKGLNLEDCD
jgi:hypothetical protein